VKLLMKNTEQELGAWTGSCQSFREMPFMFMGNIIKDITSVWKMEMITIYLTRSSSVDGTWSRFPVSYTFWTRAVSPVESVVNAELTNAFVSCSVIPRNLPKNKRMSMRGIA